VGGTCGTQDAYAGMGGSEVASCSRRTGRGEELALASRTRRTGGKGIGIEGKGPKQGKGPKEGFGGMGKDGRTVSVNSGLMVNVISG